MSSLPQKFIGYKMIDASTARGLVAQSKVLLEKYYAELGGLIEAAAMDGKSSIFPAQAETGQFRHIYEVEQIPYRSSTFKPLQKIIKAHLESLGFGVALEARQVRIGGGLGSNEYETDHALHDFIKISW